MGTLSAVGVIANQNQFNNAPFVAKLSLSGAAEEEVKVIVAVGKRVLVDWGDGTKEIITGSSDGTTHSYGATISSPTTIELKIYGTSQSLHITSLQLTEVVSFGNLKCSNFRFLNCRALIKVPDVLPPEVTNLSNMFEDCKSFNQQLDWDTSRVTTFSHMMHGCFAYNQPTNWDTSNATTLSDMFWDCRAFNQPLAFNTSKVTNMSRFLKGAWAYDQDLSHFDVSKVTAMDEMFMDASSFNADLSGWCVQRIATEPVDFATGANAWDESKRPVWGREC